MSEKIKNIKKQLKEYAKFFKDDAYPYTLTPILITGVYTLTNNFILAYTSGILFGIAGMYETYTREKRKKKLLSFDY
jgi:hypothetical protein